MFKSSRAVVCKLAGALSQRLLMAWRQLQRWWELSEQRRRLAQLDDRALHDLGLSRADAIHESERAFWDDPLAPSAESCTADSAEIAPARRLSASGYRA